ncbi:hypothetical protein M5K25_004314 [Dendrobium thyrsiflorum]|uniref:Uncharacterized protein n=1 Tax=Dendrobium thyrsiflorum TaxID=117978 RepID=A0ABD0VLB8_DENTH
MLELVFAAALSAAPLTLYIPPVRSLNPFIEMIELFVRENSGLYTNRAVPLLRFGFRRIFTALFQALSVRVPIY